MLEDEYQPLLYRDKLTVEGKQVSSDHVGSGDVEFEPIRHLQEFGVIFSYALSTAFDAYREMLTTYRPGELVLFNRKYTEKWRATFLNIPKVNYQYEHVRL